MALTSSGQWAEALPRLSQETDLQKMLADEKMRSEAHKTNYQTLKTEHTRLQDEYVQLQSEMKATIEETKLVQEKYKNLLEQAKKDNAALLAENNALREQSLNPQKLDMLRIQVLEDVEKPFRAKFEQLQEDGDKYRAEFNKLKYEYSFLKAEYEHEKTEHLRIMEEMKLRHEAEVTNLRKERASMLERSQNETGSDAQKLRTVQRENSQLQLKLKGVLAELEETRAQKEHVSTQSDNVNRLQAKQLAEHTANIKALETEKQTLKHQVETLQKELSANNELQTHLTSRTHELEKDNIVLKNKAEEAVHKSKVDLTNVRMEMLKERGELERQRDQLANTIEDLRAQIDVLKHNIQREEDTVVEKERECVQRVQAAREEEWCKLNKVETEKMELETKLQEMERRRIDDEARLHADREKMEDRLMAAKDAKDTAEKEVLVLRTKNSHQESLISQLERERSENSELKNRLHRIETAYHSYVNTEQELNDINTRLKNEVEVLKEDLRSAREEISRGKTESERNIAQHKTGWMEEKMNLKHRLDEMENQLSDSQKKLGIVLESNKKKKKKISRIVSKLKNKVQVYSAKIEELKIERDALKRYVSPEQHVQLKKKMNDLIRRHREFRAIILSGAMKEVPIGDLSFASAEINLQNSTFIDLANQHEKELMSIKERLDLLDTHQHKQMKELKEVSPIATPRKYRPSSASDHYSDHQDLYSDDGLDTEPERDPNSASVL